jgi:predicted Zn-dependent protease
LRLAGRLETARDIVAIAEAAFPGSPWVQSQKSELARDLAARQAAVTVAESAPNAGAPLTEKAFFERLQELVRLQQWNPAERLIGESRARTPKPEWLDTRDADLRLAELQIAQGRGEVSGMAVATRLYLNGSAERSKVALDLAEKYYVAGDQKGALALVQEVLKRSPDFARAGKLLAQWKPAPGPAKK